MLSIINRFCLFEMQYDFRVFLFLNIIITTVPSKSQLVTTIDFCATKDYCIWALANISVIRVLHPTNPEPAAVGALSQHKMHTRGHIKEKISYDPHSLAAFIQNSTRFAANSSTVYRHVYTTRGSRTLTKRHGN